MIKLLSSRKGAISIWTFFAALLIFGAIVGFLANSVKDMTDKYTDYTGVSINDSEFAQLKGLESQSLSATENKTADIFSQSEDLTPDEEGSFWKYIKATTSAFSRVRDGVGIAKNTLVSAGSYLEIPRTFIVVSASLITLFIVLKFLAYIKGMRWV